MKNSFKKGAASFYIVAFSTLILMIVAISFATVIISEVERTSNDDLAQSAYDSALAGIEDAKLAYFNYLNCKVDDSKGENCDRIIKIMDDLENSGVEECSMVWEVLGRSGKTGGGIIESNTGNNMQQYTTCVTMNDETPDYESRLSGGLDVVNVKFKEEDGFNYDKIKKVKISWYSDRDAAKALPNYNNFKSGRVTFASVDNIPTPPTVYLAMLQTGPVFNIDSFNTVEGGNTDRGMVYLVPAKSGTVGSGVEHNYDRAVNNHIGAGAMVKSNDKTKENKPYTVECNENGVDYLCSATIDLPSPIGGSRNPDTFMMVVGAPYGQETDFKLEFYCGEGDTNPACITEVKEGEEGTQESKPVSLKGVQLEVDSTGRANDLYRRVITRLNSKNNLALTVMGPLELLDSGENNGLKKNLTVTSEYNFKY